MVGLYPLVNAFLADNGYIRGDLKQSGIFEYNFHTEKEDVRLSIICFKDITEFNYKVDLISKLGKKGIGPRLIDYMVLSKSSSSSNTLGDPSVVEKLMIDKIVSIRKKKRVSGEKFGIIMVENHPNIFNFYKDSRVFPTKFYLDKISEMLEIIYKIVVEHKTFLPEIGIKFFKIVSGRNPKLILDISTYKLVKLEGSIRHLRNVFVYNSMIFTYIYTQSQRRANIRHTLTPVVKEYIIKKGIILGKQDMSELVINMTKMYGKYIGNRKLRHAGFVLTDYEKNNALKSIQSSRSKTPVSQGSPSKSSTSKKTSPKRKGSPSKKSPSPKGKKRARQDPLLLEEFEGPGTMFLPSPPRTPRTPRTRSPIDPVIAELMGLMTPSPGRSGRSKGKKRRVR